MKLEPQLLYQIHGFQHGLQKILLAAAIVLVICCLLAAIQLLRERMSAAVAWLALAALVTALVAAVLVAIMTPAVAGEVCVASQYGVGDGYHGGRTASGRVFDTYARDPYTIARPSRADLGRSFRITNLRNGAAIEALSTDLGPFIAGRCVDLNHAGALALGIGGLGWVRVERLD